MNIIRSPPGSGSSTERSGSYPELSTKNLYIESSDIPHQVTFRKRKQCDDNDLIKKDLSNMSNQMSEMMTYLKELNKNQTENLNKLCSDVNAIRENINEIKSVVQNLTTEQNKIKSQVVTLTEYNDSANKRIESLESKIQQLKITTTVASTSVPSICEDIMAELSDRNLRSKNIIMIGIPEQNSADTNENSDLDKSEVSKVIKILNPNYPEPEKTIRLGKYNVDKKRPIKVSFASQSTVISILRNKTKIKDYNVRIYSDQTPQQRSHLKRLKEELENRKTNGEMNLSIRYVKGVPKIIQIPPKN